MVRYVEVTGDVDVAGNVDIAGDLTVAGSSPGGATTSGTADPADQDLITWTQDIITCNAATGALVSGRLYISRLQVRAAVTPTTLYWHKQGGGLTPVAGQNEVGLYNSAGALLDSTNVDAEIGSTGIASTTITPGQLAAGFYWASFLFNASTAPNLTRGFHPTSTGTSINLNLPIAEYRYATNGDALTALPASITPANNSFTGVQAIWAAIG